MFFAPKSVYRIPLLPSQQTQRWLNRTSLSNQDTQPELRNDFLTFFKESGPARETALEFNFQKKTHPLFSPPPHRSCLTGFI